MTERRPPSARLAQLYAVRAQIDALIIAEELDEDRAEAQAPDDGTPSCPTCGSRETRDASTVGGGPRRICMRCGMTFPVAEVSQP